MSFVGCCVVSATRLAFRVLSGLRRQVACCGRAKNPFRVAFLKPAQRNEQEHLFETVDIYGSAALIDEVPRRRAAPVLRAPPRKTQKRACI